jgi:hypothetical protein
MLIDDLKRVDERLRSPHPGRSTDVGFHH